MATVMSRKIRCAQDHDAAKHHVGADDDEPDFIASPLSQHVTRNGVTVRVEIYGDSNSRWMQAHLVAMDAGFPPFLTASLRIRTGRYPLAKREVLN
jgi:hypothetical protein